MIEGLPETKACQKQRLFRGMKVYGTTALGGDVGPLRGVLSDGLSVSPPRRGRSSAYYFEKCAIVTGGSGTGGACWVEAALNFYTACGLGTITEIIRYGSEGAPAGAPGMHGKVMHARFDGAGVLFYASDNDDAEPMRGSAHILMMDDRPQTIRLFDQLQQGGRVTTPLGIQPWGAFYGKLTDRFGVQWMLNCPVK